MQEPICDPERLKTDKAYRYSKIDELTAYMETIEPYSQRVEYFMNTTLALGFELRPFNMGSLSIYDDDNKTGVRKWWWLNDPANDADKALSRKLWFEKARHTVFPRFGQTTNETLEQRKSRYFANSEGWNLVEYAREQLTAIKAGISQFQAEYTTFREEKGKLSHEPEQVQQQRLNAPALIKSELLGNPVINWLAFSRSNELQSFGILWDMVGFALFVKKQISTPTPPDQQGQAKATRSAANMFADDVQKQGFMNDVCQCIENVRGDKAKVLNVVSVHDRVLLEQLLSELRLPSVVVVNDSDTLTNLVEGDVEQIAIPTSEDVKSTSSSSKKPAAPIFADFTSKLQNGFTEVNLNALLVHVRFKNEAGKTLKFTGYLMHHVIDALIKAEYFDRGNRERDQKALQRFLGLPETRVTKEYGSKKSVKELAESYLSELKKQRKINR